MDHVFIFTDIYLILPDRDSALGIVIRLWAGRPLNRGSILFSDAVNSSDYTGLNGRTISE
jgi:hypothetical protein